MRRNWPWSLPQQLQKTKVLKRRHWKAFFSTPCNTWKPIEFATRHLKDRQHSKNTQYETNSCLNSKKFPARGKFVKTIESWHLSKNDNCKMSLWSSVLFNYARSKEKRKSWAGFDIIWNSPEVLEDIISWDKVFCVPGSRHNYQTWKVRAEWDWERPRRSWEALWWRPQKLGL